MIKARVGILMGGFSSEAHISEKSAHVVARSLDPDKYDVALISVTENGWNVIKDDSSLKIDLNAITYKSNEKDLGFDVFFNAIHGTPGEDGKIQGLLEMHGIPYTGSEVLSSALSFDKGVCNTFLRGQKGLNIIPSLILKKGDPINIEEILEEISIPCFVKPCQAGSSYGISKVNAKSELELAIAEAFRFDSSILVEEFIDGTEVSNGVYSCNGEIHSLPITEIVPEGSFFDYEAKYKGSSEEITPAQISEELTAEVQKMTRTVFSALGLKGMARADYIIQNGTPFLIEVNTVPGLSEQSLLPQQVVESGMTLQEFFGLLIEEALDQSKS